MNSQTQDGSQADFQPQPVELRAETLHHPCDPENLGFKTTDELPDLQSVIGQPRAMRALELGSEVSGAGYNIFVTGLPGSGRTTLSVEFLKRKAAQEPPPDDWCYVNNFSDPHAPRALRLPGGKGSELRQDIQTLVDYCRREMPRTFESEEYTRERDRLVSDLKRTQEAEFIHLQEHVEKFQFNLARTPMGIILSPAVKGKPLKSEDIENLTPEQRAKLEGLQVKLTEEVEHTLYRLREMARKASEALEELNRHTALYLIKDHMAMLRDKYLPNASSEDGKEYIDPLREFLEAVEADIAEHSDGFRSASGSDNSETGGMQQVEVANFLLRYAVNVLVDNREARGAPVILESYPAYHALLGRIEHEVVLGATRTNFTMIRPGAIHRANGGYLVLPVRDLLLSPYAWEGLKRVLRDGKLRIMELGNYLGLLSTETLEPEPIPLQVKVVLVGTPILDHLLRAYDEDFAKLFKVRAEFATLMERNTQTEQEYGLFVKSVVMDNQLPPFESSAVARIIEWSSRLAEDQGKLSTRFGRISDLVCEAAYWARKEFQAHGPDSKPMVREVHVEQAIHESIYRNNLIEERLQELIAQDTLLIDVEGTKIGQINGLAVLQLGDGLDSYTFGRPCRLTASAYAGHGGVIDIERQAKLGGPIHTKGVLIITGLLGQRYGRKTPISLSASLTFEQSYDEIEGDSASAAELFALLSAITNQPIRQDRAVTGSINQHGQIQPIGGVNQKIEGFFDVCRLRGLTGEQGVLIPVANQRNLNLRDDVVAAVGANQFHIWPIRTIDQGIPLLTGISAGEPNEDGTYPNGTFNAIVTNNLAAFAESIAHHKKEDHDG